MSNQDQQNIFTTAVGRLLWEQLNTPRTKDFDGNPLVVKDGPDKGKPTQRYECGVGFDKDPAVGHWANTDWGKLIWATGHAAHPQAAQRPDFAWKVVDGDSTVPNKKGNRPCDNENFRGKWVVTFSSSFAPKFVTHDGKMPITEPNAVKAGYYVQVRATVAGNTGASPGVYINHVFIALSGYGPEIFNGPDPSSAGFGQAPLPAGASRTPVAGVSSPPPAPGSSAPATGSPPPPPGAGAPPPATPPPTPTTPHTGFLNPAGAPPPPAVSAPPPPAAPPAGPQMTAKATTTYAAYRAANWTDEQLRANGLMV